jgi:hypothetical protein
MSVRKLGFALLLGLYLSVYASASCSNATLVKIYGFTVTGVNSSGSLTASVGQLTADGKGNFTGIETVSGPRGLRLVVDKLSHAPLVSGFRRFNGAIEFATSRGGDRTYYASVIANDGAHKREHALVDDIEAVKIEEKWVLSQLQSLLILLGVTVPILRG